MAFMKFAKWNPLSQPQAYEPVEGGTAHLPLKRENKKSRSLAGRLLLSPVLSVVSMGFIIANIGSYMVMNQRIDFLKHFCPDLPYSPEVTGFRFSHMVMDLYSYDPYKDYGKESDRAWDNLLDKQYFRATKEEMIAWGEFDENSIELEDGGYVAQLRLFRELQCLDFIKRQYGNPAVRAVTNFTEADKDHCLNVLLQGTRCRADTTLSGWFIKEEDLSKPLINRSHARHVCVEWQSVVDWLLPRALGSSEAALSKHGKLSQEEMLRRSRAH